MDFHNALIRILVYAIPVIFAIALHEAAHGYVAKHFGDSTAYMLGRVTLNPAKHIDPVGTILVPIITVIFSGYMFGWAKPVPVNFANLRDPKKDMLWVAAAGPASNLVQMLIWGIVAKMLVEFAPQNGLVGSFWLSIAEAGVGVNLMFAILNLLPILPLDGGRVLTSLLPNRLAYAYSRLEPYGMVILFILLFTGILNFVLGPVYVVSKSLVYSTLGLA
jgi:Zn-dependent protease